MKKYVSKKKTVMLTLACTTAIGGSSIFASTAYAEEMQVFSLDTMVVTASRVETSKADTPANITVISQEKLEESNYADAAEALADVPGVNILSSGAKGSNMGQDVIMLNGDKRVLVLIDGRRVDVASSGNYSADWLPPVNAIERIEVLKGAGSALYGTDAVGGVINIITKKVPKLATRLLLKLQQAPGIRNNMASRQAAAMMVSEFLLAPTRKSAAIILTRIIKPVLSLK